MMTMTIMTFTIAPRHTQHDLFQEDGETQESLVKKWKELVVEWNHCHKSLLEAQQQNESTTATTQHD